MVDKLFMTALLACYGRVDTGSIFGYDTYLESREEYSLTANEIR